MLGGGGAEDERESVNATDEMTSPPALERRRRWGWVVAILLLIAGLALAAVWVARRPVVEVVSPGILVVNMELSDFAGAYYELLTDRNWKIVREFGQGSAGDRARLRVGRSGRTFSMSDGMEVTLDCTHDGDRHIVFLSLRPSGQPPPAEEMTRRAQEITNALADAWREKARQQRWRRLKKLAP